MPNRIAVLMIVAALPLAACGTTPGDRGLSGAGLGAASGAVIGALIGGPVLAAAAIGAGVGAATGLVSSPSTVELGRPIWDK